MVDVIATERGYFGRQLREEGERFHIPDERWADEKRRPKWVKLAPFGGKGDHDRDGVDGGSRPTAPTDNIDDMTKAQLIQFAKDNDINVTASGKKDEVLAEIKAALGGAEAEPFADAPDPVYVQNEANDITGQTEPDWVMPAAGKPKAVED